MSTASSTTSVEKQQNAGVSKVVEEGTSSASPSTLIGQQQTAGDSSVAEEAMSSSPATLIDQKNAGPSTAVEGQLRKPIARLEDDIHQLKLDQDPNREAVKYTLLRDELAQLREKELNVRVELQLARESVWFLEKKLEKHQVLGSELERCKQLMQKAINDLSNGLDLSNRKSPKLGLATEAVPFGASLLPQQSVSSGPIEKPLVSLTLSKVRGIPLLLLFLLAAQTQTLQPKSIPSAYLHRALHNYYRSRPVLLR